MEVTNFLINKSNWNDDNLFKPLEESARYYNSKVKDLSDVRDTIKKHFLLEDGVTLTRQQVQQLENEINKASGIIKEDFPESNVNVYIFGMSKEDTFIMEKMNGVGGFAFENVVLAYFHPDSGCLEGNLIQKVLIHESNHFIRYPYGNPYKTFLDYLILEGLAEVYLSEKFPNDSLSPWVSSTTEQQLIDLKPQVEEFWLTEPQPDAREWAFGSKEKGIPPWFGYALGFDMVKKHRANYLDLSWSEYIKIPSCEFIE